MQPILHIPHSSITIPDAFRDRFLVNERELQHELLKMTDHFTDELFACDDCQRLVFPVSRLLTDVERFADDALEPMAAVGMGVHYTKTHDGRPLRTPPDESEREALLEAYYLPHHRTLTGLVDAQLADHGRSLIIDCHSFPGARLPYQPETPGDYPEICIGTDAYHTPKELRDRALVVSAELGFTVGLNHPFSGAITPLKHLRSHQKVHAIMIEIRRDLYMDEATGEKSERFDAVAEAVRNLIQAIQQ